MRKITANELAPKRVCACLSAPQPAGAPKITGHSAALMTPVTVTSFALSLLLVFKTNSSCACVLPARWHLLLACKCVRLISLPSDTALPARARADSRWSAAVGCWGGVFSKARTFLRLATSFVGPSNPELMPALFSWACAFMPAMAAQLRSQQVSAGNAWRCSLQAEAASRRRCIHERVLFFLRAQHYIYRHLSGILTEAELDWLASRANPANAVMQVGREAGHSRAFRAQW